MSEQSNPVVLFLINCGNENLQYLLVPARLDAAMAAIDTDSDGEITAIEWEEAIEVALRAKLAARAERRAKSSAAARKEIAEFTAEFLSAAREVFELMDEDDSGTLVVDEIVKAVDPKKGNKVANAASYNRAPFNLRGLRGLCDRPSRHHFLSTRRKSSSSSRAAASRTCSFWSGRRPSDERCACSTSAATARSTSTSGASCSVFLHE